MTLACGLVPTGDDDDTVREDRWVAPNKQLTAFTIYTGYYPVDIKGGDGVDTYQMIAIRAPGMQSPGVTLSRAKYFEAQWSPDSRYLAVFKYYLTHNTDIDVYRIEEDGSHGRLTLSLIYSRSALANPRKKRWINWEFKSWDLKRSALNITEKNDNPNYYDGVKTIAVDLKAKAIRKIEYAEE